MQLLMQGNPKITLICLIILKQPWFLFHWCKEVNQTQKILIGDKPLLFGVHRDLSPFFKMRDMGGESHDRFLI